jgi:flagellar biosynthesis protein FlhG
MSENEGKKERRVQRSHPVRTGQVIDFRHPAVYGQPLPANRPPSPRPRSANDDGFRVISVASGKGGVGKTNVVANLAVALRRRGKKVIVIDADLALANVDTLLGLHPKATLRHVLLGECSISDVLLEGPAGVRIVPAASGFEELTNLDRAQRLHLLEEIDRLEDAFDVLLIDTAAGISPNVLFFTVAAQETLVVTTPEPTSLTDAYALIKVLTRRYSETDFGVLVNMARNEAEARRAFQHLSRVASRFLNVNLRYEGMVPFDHELPEAVRRQRTVLDLAPSSPASRAFDFLAEQIATAPTPLRAKGGLQFFFRRLLEEDRS